MGGINNHGGPVLYYFQPGRPVGGGNAPGHRKVRPNHTLTGQHFRRRHGGGGIYLLVAAHERQKKVFIRSPFP